MKIALSLGASLFFAVAVAQAAEDSPAAAPPPAEDVEAIVVELSAGESPGTGNTAADPAESPDSVWTVQEDVGNTATDNAATDDVSAADSAAIVPEQSAAPVSSESIEVIMLSQPEKPAKPKYKKDDVLWIQRRLEELGYYTGAVDGAFGQLTRNAIKAYQADQELEQDGRPTPELRDFMWRNGG